MSAGFGQPPRFSGGLGQNGIVIPEATETTPGLLSPEDKTKLDLLLPDFWDQTLVRYYLVDYDNGVDSATGFVDAAAQTDVSGSSALAIKTLTHLREIMPANGNGMRAVILVKPRAAGATYLQPDGVTADSLDLRGLTGYTSLMARGSDSFVNNAADYNTLGGIQTLAGPGAAGVWTCAAGATTSVFTVSAGALTAEPALIGHRVRFTGNVTAGLANACGMILSNTGTVITLAVALGSAPANGDTFTIEGPGVRVHQVFYNSFIGSDSPIPLDNQSLFVTLAVAAHNVVIAGFDANTSTDEYGFVVGGHADHLYMSFCRVSNVGDLWRLIFFVKGALLSLSDRYMDEAGTLRTPGVGICAEGNYYLGLGPAGAHGGYVWERSCAAKASITSNSQVQYRHINAGNLGQGCYYGKAVIFHGVASMPRVTSTGNAESGVTFGSRAVAGVQTTRILGASAGVPLQIFRSHLYVYGVDIQQAAANAAIKITGHGSCVGINGVAGGTSNTGQSLDLTTAYDSNVLVGIQAANTIASSGGDMLLAGSAIAAFADLALTNVVDNQRNNVQGTGGLIVDACRLVTNKAGAALAVGDNVRSNGTSGQVTSATGNSATIGDSSHIGVAVTAAADNGLGYIAGPGYCYCLFDGAPTVGAIAYLSPGTVRKLTTTVPAVAANNNKLRVGRVVSVPAGSTGIVRVSPENLAIVADGAA